MNKLAIAIALLLVACSPPQTSSDIQRQRQEVVVAEGVQEVGVPSITNFRELKLAKDLYELRDQTGLTTYTYLWSDVQGKTIFLCDSIGYPLPYSVQYSAPESVQTWNIARGGSGSDIKRYGTDRLPQAEPNGLFSPASAEGTWVLCKNPNKAEVIPTYVEPRIIVTQFKLP